MRVEARGEVPEDEAATAFVLSVLPLVLPFFDVEPLHGSGAANADRRLVMLGGSGAGKSSTLARLEEFGWSFVTDDACAVDQDERLWPGAPFLNPRVDDTTQHVVGSYNRKLLRTPHRHELEPRPISHVVVLQPKPTIEAPRLRDLTSDEAFMGILRNVRSPSFLGERRQRQQLHLVSRLATTTASVLAEFDPERSDYRELARCIASWAS
jgi:hypothetical protein